MVIINNKLYVRATPPGDVTKAKLFIIPRAYWRRAIDGCHQDASHQGQNCTLSLAAERFWWPNMPSEVRNVVKNCQKCVMVCKGRGYNFYNFYFLVPCGGRLFYSHMTYDITSCICDVTSCVRVPKSYINPLSLFTDSEQF